MTKTKKRYIIVVALDIIKKYFVLSGMPLFCLMIELGLLLHQTVTGVIQEVANAI